MLVILRETIQNLGRTGDVVKVSDGYARNFLLPRNLVMVAEEKNVAAVEHAKRVLEKKREAEKADAMALAQKLNNFTCTVARKVGEGDKLFGSVSSGDIAELMKNAGFNIDKRSVILDSPIKALGMHSVTVKLESDVTATVKVSVVKEKA
jgi:large subunit ribosomal protein L9